MNYKKLVCLFLWVYCGYTSAQSVNKTDTVEIARNLGYAKKYSEAISLLQQFEINHPKDINSVRVHGQILYWCYNFDAAFLMYQAALKRNPNPYVQLDYGRMLFELYHLQEAKQVLEDYLKTDGKNVEALNTLGNIAYWQGHTALAKQYFARVMQQYPTNDWAVKYVNEMLDGAKPYLTIGSAYNNDSQPLSSVLANVETGWYSSYLLAPKFDLSVNNFSADGSDKQLYAFNAANKFYFANLNLKATLGAGAYKSPADNKAGWTGFILLDEKLNNEFSLDAYASHKAYFYTLGSLKQPVTFYNYGADLLFNKADSWSGWVGYNIQQFMDNNTIQHMGASLLSPPLKVSGLNFYLGYAFNFSNAATDQYASAVTVNQVLAGSAFSGIYTPYFTPDAQIENSVLANVVYKPVKALRLSVNSRVGLFTTADKPYFYLNYSASNQLIIQKAYYSQKYTPVQISGALNYAFSNKLSLDAGYTYVNTFFYSSNTANLGLNFKF